MKNPRWTEIPLRILKKPIYGLVINAYANAAGDLLLHHKDLPRRAKGFKNIGHWAVWIKGTNKIAEKHYCHRTFVKAPVTWASQEIRKYHENCSTSRS